MFVHTDSLTKRYGRLTALDGCSLGVERGEVFGLLGPNGAGKTTLLRLLMGFLRPTSGRATIDDLDCYRQAVAVHRRVAYLPGDPRLFRRMTGRAVLKFFSEIRPGGDFPRAMRLADRLRLDVSRQVGRSSTGMRQKLALAATLSADVPLLVLDEPTSSLDPTVRGEVLKLVAEARDEGRTVLLSSHVLSEVEQTCDRVVILRAGRPVHTQQMAQLHRQHRIHAELDGPLPAPPAALAGSLTVSSHGERAVTIQTPGELSPVLGWLASLPLREVRIEPVGLQAVYDRYHAEDGRP